MNDQDDAYQRATIREQRAEIDRLTADNAHLAEVVGTQSARLEKQARELADLRVDVVALQTLRDMHVGEISRALGLDGAE